MKRMIFAALAALALGARADGDAPKVVENTFGAEVRPAWVIPTNSFVRDNDVRVAVMPHLRYSFRFAPHTRQGYFHPTAYQGVGLSYIATAPGSALGHPTTLYLFQGARLASLAPGLSIDYEWNFGVSAFWDAYDPELNPENGSIGSKVNAYLNLGVVLSYKLSPHWKVTLGIDGSHFSDGNSRLPNAGVNMVGGRIGLCYVPGDVPDFGGDVHYDFEPGWGYDILAYGAPRQRMIDIEGEKRYLPRTFGVGGVCFAPMYAFNPLLRVGGSLDMQYDDGANLYRNKIDGYWGEDVKFFRQPLSERFSVGLSVHAELTMPIFSINVGIGRNIIAKGADTSIFYQTLALKAYVFKNAYVNVGYQLRDFHLPNNLMLGVGYTIGRR